MYANKSYFIMTYNSRTDVVRLLAERYDTKSKVMLGGFRSQLQASYVFNHTEDLWYNYTVCLRMNTHTHIYIYIYIYIYIFYTVFPWALIRLDRFNASTERLQSWKVPTITGKDDICRLWMAAHNAWGWDPGSWAVCNLENEVVTCLSTQYFSTYWA